ncbi:MAG: hypothetical protein Lokiarch_16620 [Candidatus Lokiarchaeum sp. GC14_75]|nr:MAG: hypothetical protein Lokiarch_16620 [Candidatus Lokiarchaeum sp. GC14_75]
MGIIKKLIGIDNNGDQKSPLDKPVNISNLDSNDVFLLTDSRY